MSRTLVHTPPEMIYDLPAAMPWLMLTAQGYVATLVSGEVVQENGAATGARPGKVIRGTEGNSLATKTRSSGLSA